MWYYWLITIISLIILIYPALQTIACSQPSKQCRRSLIGSTTKFYFILFSAEQFRSRFEGKTYHKITIGLNLFVDNSLKDFEAFWRKEEWKLVSLVLERFFTYIFLFSVLISFLVFAATVR